MEVVIEADEALVPWPEEPPTHVLVLASPSSSAKGELLKEVMALLVEQGGLRDGHRTIRCRETPQGVHVVSATDYPSRSAEHAGGGQDVTHEVVEILRGKVRLSSLNG